MKCELAFLPCQLRQDADLRRFESARRRSTQIPFAELGERSASDLRSEVANLLKNQVVSQSARSIRQRLSTEVTESEILTVLRSIDGVFETSPNMFRLRPDVIGPDANQQLTTTGGQLARAIVESQVLTDQVPLFKRLRALEAWSDGVGSRAGPVPFEMDLVLARESWTIGDLVAVAVTDRRPDPVIDDDAYEEMRSRILLAQAISEWATERDRAFDEVGTLRKRLLVSNLRLIANIAARHRTASLTFADLFQEGVFGLSTAISRFDPYRGFTFSTFATPWVKQAISRARDNQDREIRVPVHALEALRRGDQPLASVARTVPVSPPDLADETDLEENAVWVEAAINIRSMVASMSESDRLVLTRRFGLLDGETQTLEAIGARLGVTRERVRQIETRALRALRSSTKLSRLEGVIAETLTWEAIQLGLNEASRHHKPTLMVSGATVTVRRAF
jgi:RNA polymerase sigma factor (sigma-70 family)